MRNAIKYILYVQSDSNAMNSLTRDTRIAPVTPWWETALYALDAVTVVLMAAACAWYIVSLLRKKRQ